MEEGITMSLSEWLKAQMEQKRISVQTLVKSSGVPPSYVEAFLTGDFTKLPAAPYVRGYLRALAPVVDGDPDELWRLFKAETTPKVSGAEDVLPRNRFTIPAVKMRPWIILGVVGAIAFVYLIFNGGRLLGKPSLIVTEPSETNFQTVDPDVIFRGVVNPDDVLTVAEEVVVVEPTGSFTTRYALIPGFNVIVIEAKRFLGRTTALTYEIIYEPATTTTAVGEVQGLSP